VKKKRAGPIKRSKGPVPIAVPIPAKSNPELEIDINNKYQCNRGFTIFTALILVFWPEAWGHFWLVGAIIANSAFHGLAEIYINRWEQKKLKRWQAEMISQAILAHKNSGECHATQAHEPES